MSNPNELNWTMYQDIQVSEKSLRDQFEGYMNSGMFAEALALLRTNKQKLKGRAYVSSAINEILQGADFLESQFIQNVPAFLSALASRYYALIDEFRKRGEWISNGEYGPYNFVVYQEEIYMAIKIVPNGILPTDSEYWLGLGLRGAEGVPGLDVKMQYAWSAVRQYVARDLVTYKDSIYVAKKPNQGIEPGTDPATWMVFINIARGKINVGPTAPDTTQQNSIWFKTLVDPLETTDPVNGEMMIYKGAEGWTPMYPTTFFTLILGAEAYAPKPYVDNIVLTPDQWIDVGGVRTIEYQNYRIKDTSYVTIDPYEMPMESRNDFNNLSADIALGKITFKLSVVPSANIPLTIKIQ